MVAFDDRDGVLIKTPHFGSLVIVIVVHGAKICQGNLQLHFVAGTSEFSTSFHVHSHMNFLLTFPIEAGYQSRHSISSSHVYKLAYDVALY